MAGCGRPRRSIPAAMIALGLLAVACAGPDRAAGPLPAIPPEDLPEPAIPPEELPEPAIPPEELPEPAAAPIDPMTTVSSEDLSLQARDLLLGVNIERAAVGLPPLVPRDGLMQAAGTHAYDLTTMGLLSHTGSDGSDVGVRVRQAGYPYHTVAENLAAGQENAAEVVNDWMHSAGHRANILNPAVSDIGVARAEGPPVGDAAGHYWVIVLAGR